MNEDKQMNTGLVLTKEGIGGRYVYAYYIISWDVFWDDFDEEVLWSVEAI